jgi:hypothetical protein
VARPFAERELKGKLSHGLNTDRMQAGKALVPVSYPDGGARAMALAHGEITEKTIGAAFEVVSIGSPVSISRTMTRSFSMSSRRRESASGFSRRRIPQCWHQRSR